MVATQLQLIDRMTAPIMSINRSIDQMTAALNAAEQSANMDTSALSEMRSRIDAANAYAEQLNETFELVNNTIQQSAQEQEKLNAKIQKGNGLFGQFKGAFGGLAGFFSLKAGIGFVQESLDLTNQQIRAEQQLVNVLSNQGGTQEDFNALKQRAAEIQSKTMYSEEAMLGGAGELATYLSDVDAIQVAMGSLADFTAGMAGGTEVGYQQMIQYATQFGKALNGTFAGISQKGFNLTDAQKEIIKNGTDMQKALVLKDVIGQSWDGLSEQMARTPDGMRSNMITAINTVRKKFGAELLPAIMSVFDAVQSRMPQIEAAIMSAVPAVRAVIAVVGRVAGAALSVYNYFVKHWAALSPVIYAVASALLVFKLHAAAAALHASILAGNVGILTTAKGIYTTATNIATAAQMGFNAAVRAFPASWILMIIGAVIGAIFAFVHACGGLHAAWLTTVNFLCWAVDTMKMNFFQAFYGVLNLLDLFKLKWLQVVDWVVSVVEGMKNGVLQALSGMINLALKGINAFIGLLNKLPGVKIDLIEPVDLTGRDKALKDAEKRQRAAETATVKQNAAEPTAARQRAAETATVKQNATGLPEARQRAAETATVKQNATGLPEARQRAAETTTVQQNATGLPEARQRATETTTVQQNATGLPEARQRATETTTVQQNATEMTAAQQRAARIAAQRDALNANNIARSGALDAMEEKASNAMYDRLKKIEDVRKKPVDAAMTASSFTNKDGLDGISRGVDAVVSNTANAAEITEENLKYLRDIAERDTINQFTTAEIKFDMGGVTNNVSSGLDLQGLMDFIEEGVSERLMIAAEGVTA